MLENGPTLALFVLFIRRHISGCCVLYARLKHRNQALTKNKVRETFFFVLPFFPLTGRPPSGESGSPQALQRD